LLLILIRKKYSKSGVKLPITSPVSENHFLEKNVSGKTIAGCENVNGIFSYIRFVYGVVLKLAITFRGFASVVMPANCVLSAKIKYFREERSSIQEKTSNSAKPLLVLRRV